MTWWKMDGQLRKESNFTSVDFTPDLENIDDFVPKKRSYSEPVWKFKPRRI